MADRLAEGHLAEQIAALRTQGHTFEQVARALNADFGIEVTGETIRKWARQLGVPEQVKAAS
jgi:superfamily II helicase